MYQTMENQHRFLCSEQLQYDENDVQYYYTFLLSFNSQTVCSKMFDVLTI